MDVLDAGVFVLKFEANLANDAQPVLWGPLQATEMGLDGWEVQDGGETGFVFHNHRALSLGRGTATLIVVRRLKKAFLTIYMGGYPTDTPESQRRLEAQRVVSACALYLGRLTKSTVDFDLKADIALVDQREQVLDAAPPPSSPASLPSPPQVWDV